MFERGKKKLKFRMCELREEWSGGRDEHEQYWPDKAASETDSAGQINSINPANCRGRHPRHLSVPMKNGLPAGQIDNELS